MTNSQEVLKNRKAKSEVVRKLKSFVGCQICGENESCCLDFHHLDPLQKDTTLAKMLETHRSLEDILAEIKKCVILCANCHRKVHANILVVPEMSREDFYSLVDAFVIPKIINDYRCVDCNKTISSTAKRCLPCSTKNARKIVWPNPAVVAHMVMENGFSGTGRLLGLSDSAVRKHYGRYCC